MLGYAASSPPLIRPSATFSFRPQRVLREKGSGGELELIVT